jgi:hypothetical protein
MPTAKKLCDEGICDKQTKIDQFNHTAFRVYIAAEAE